MTERRSFVVGTFVAAVLVIGAAVGWSLRPGSETGGGVEFRGAADETQFEHDYVIPAGTALQIDAGETVEIVPSELAVDVGDAIRIVNDDASDHVVGVFFVGVGETLTQRFTSPGVLSGSCTVHSGGEFSVRVRS